MLEQQSVKDEVRPHRNIVWDDFDQGYLPTDAVPDVFASPDPEADEREARADSRRELSGLACYVVFVWAFLIFLCVGHSFWGGVLIGVAGSFFVVGLVLSHLALPFYDKQPKGGGDDNLTD